MARKSVEVFCARCHCRDFSQHPRPQNISTLDIAWLAGILEGEGSFICNAEDRRFSINIRMTDKDVMEHVAQLLRSALHLVQSPAVMRRLHHKPIWVTSLSSGPAAAWMMTLLPLLGKRRRQRALAALATWRWKPLKRQLCACRKDTQALCRLCTEQFLSSYTLQKAAEFNNLFGKSPYATYG